MSAARLSIAVLASLYSLRVSASHLYREESPCVSLAYCRLSSNGSMSPESSLPSDQKLVITSPSTAVNMRSLAWGSKVVLRREKLALSDYIRAKESGMYRGTEWHTNSPSHV